MKSCRSIHKSRFAQRHLTAVILMTVYLLIVVSPLTPLAFKSSSVAHALAGECVGDCKLCNCSPAASAGNTCCCAKKRQQRLKLSESSAKSDCAEQPVPTTPLKKGSCCPKKTAKHPVDQKQKKSVSTPNNSVLKCGCPGDSGKLPAITGFESKELLTIATSEGLYFPSDDTFYACRSQRLLSRDGEPPVPPPKILQNS